MAGLARGGGHHLVETKLSEPGKVAALAWREDTRIVLWLADLAAEPLTIRMAGLQDARLQASVLELLLVRKGSRLVGCARGVEASARGSGTQLRRLRSRTSKPTTSQRTQWRPKGEEHDSARPEGAGSDQESKFGHFVVEFATPRIRHILSGRLRLVSSISSTPGSVSRRRRAPSVISRPPICP